MAYFKQPLHTTKESGYGSPDFRAIAKAYGIKVSNVVNGEEPVLIEIPVDSNVSLSPVLPRGMKCQDMTPELPAEKHNYLDNLQ